MNDRPRPNSTFEPSGRPKIAEDYVADLAEGKVKLSVTDPDPDEDKGGDPADPDSYAEIARQINEAVLEEVHEQLKDVIGSPVRDKRGEELLADARAAR